MSRTRCFNWDMRLYGECESWWDADQEVTINVGVSTWGDLSGKNRDLVAPSTAKEPTVVSAVNGRSAIKFDATDDCLEVPSSQSYYNFLHDGSTATMLLVAKPLDVTNTGTVVVVFDNNNSDSSQIGTRLHWEDRSVIANDSLYAYITNGSGVPVSAYVPSNTFTPTTDYYRVCMVIDADASTGERAIYQVDSGSEIKPNTGTLSPTASNATHPFTLAANGGVQSKTSYVIYIAELVFYSGTTSKSKEYLQLLHSHKWGF